MCGDPVVWYVVLWVTFTLSYPVLILKKLFSKEVESENSEEIETAKGSDLIEASSERFEVPNSGIHKELEANPRELSKGLEIVSFLVYTGPLFSLYKLWTHYSSLKIAGTWLEFKSPVSPLYYPQYRPSLMILIFSISIILMFQLLQIALFVKRDSRFPTIFTYVLILSVFSLTLVFLSFLINPSTNAVLIGTYVKEIGGVSVVAFLWIWYLVVSERVIDTFVGRNKTFQFLSSKLTLATPVVLLTGMFLYAVF